MRWVVIGGAPARKIKQGKLFEQGIRLEDQDARVDLAWDSLRCTHLGRIKPVRQALAPHTEESPKTLSSVFSAGLSKADENKPATVEQQPYLVLDLYAGDGHYRLDTVTTNLRSFLGQEAGYSGDVNLVTLVNKIAQAAPQALDASVQDLLAKGRGSVPSYPDLEAFRSGSATALNRHTCAPSIVATRTGLSEVPIATPVSPAPAPAIHSGAAVQSTTPSRRGTGLGGSPRMDYLDPTAGPGLGPFLLTVSYLVGFFFMLLGVWASFLKGGETADGVGFWIGAGLSLSIAGLGTIRARTGSTRPYLEANLWLLRLWFVLAGVGFIVFGLCLGIMDWSMYQGMSDMGAPERVSKGMIKLGLFVVAFMACCGVASVVFFGLGVNLLFLALGNREHLLDSPTLLDFLNIT